MSVITISRQYGSGGDQVADLVCQITGYRLFDKHLLTEAAQEAGFTDREIIDYSEESHKVKTFIDRLIGQDTPTVPGGFWTEAKNGVGEEIQLDEKFALDLILKAVQAAYDMGKIVIAGRGGQVILREHPDVLHVRVVADLDDRILRVRHDPLLEGRSFNDSADVHRAAQELLEERDAASADYLQRFYGVDWADPSYYHLVINTSKLKPDSAAKMIVQTARLLEHAFEV